MGYVLRHTQTSSRGESGAYQRALVSGHSEESGLYVVTLSWSPASGARRKRLATAGQAISDAFGESR